MKKFYALFLIFCALHTAAQTTLVPGNLAVVGYNYDDPDNVRIVTFVNLAAGTSFKITDNGWNGSALTTNEGTHTYTASSAINAGSVISINTSGTAFSANGDQIIIYQGTASNPTFVYALSTTQWVTGNVNSNSSRIPAGLTNGVNALAFATERDNGKYNTITNSGTASALLANVVNSANWSNTDSRISTFPAWTFSITGNTVAEPANPTNFTFSNIKTWTFDAGFTASASTNVSGYIVLCKEGSPSAAVPADGTAYMQGDFIGDAQVASVGTATSFSQKGVVANTTYYYTVHSYTGSGASINYNQTAPLAAAIVTPADAIGSYYALINTNTTSFVDDLKNRIRAPYTKIDYAQFDETNVANFAVRDAPGGQKFVECVYSGQVYAYTLPFAWTPTTPFSREHTFCHSWMPTYPSESGQEYSDQHHLFPVNQNSANAVRSNHPLGEVNVVTSSFLEGKYGLDINGNKVYEPRESHKGNAARALFYMSMKYDGVNANNWTFDYVNSTILPALSESAQDVDLLLAWHIVDDPDNQEITRNDYVQSAQQNRNPFVDHPEYVNYINLNNLTYVAPPAMAEDNTTTAAVKSEQVWIDQATAFDALVYPIPSSGDVNIELNRTIKTQVYVQWMDMQGNVVKEEVLESDNLRSINTEANELPNGLYLMNIRLGAEHITVRWMKN